MENLGIEPVLLLTQVINFVVLLVILTKFVYKPILNALETRKKKIEEGINLTQKMLQEKADLEIEKKKVLDTARKEGQGLIEQSRKEGSRLEQEIIAAARKESQQIIQRGKRDLEIKLREAEANLAKNTTNLVISLTKKLIGEILDETKMDTLLQKRVSRFLKDKL